MAAASTIGPAATRMGARVAAMSGMVHATAAPKERPCRIRRKAYPRHASSFATP
jgi:hypothetical protein